MTNADGRMDRETALQLNSYSRCDTLQLMASGPDKSDKLNMLDGDNGSTSPDSFQIEME